MSEWDWELTDTSRRDFAGLDDRARDRIASKPDEIVTDGWRDPSDHLEPLHGAPHEKLRIGQFQLGIRADRTEHILYVLRVRKAVVMRTGVTTIDLSAQFSNQILTFSEWKQSIVAAYNARFSTKLGAEVSIEPLESEVSHERSLGTCTEYIHNSGYPLRDSRNTSEMSVIRSVR